LAVTSAHDPFGNDKKRNGFDNGEIGRRLSSHRRGKQATSAQRSQRSPFANSDIL
jgi:hypothetical protein